jgi:hypothetical protein
VDAVLGAEAARCHAELLQRVGERQRQVGVVLRVVVHGAVEQIRDAEGKAAADRDVDAAAHAAAVRDTGLHGGAAQHDEVGDLAPLQRQLVHVLDDVADAAAADVNQRRRRLDGDRLREAADFELRVDCWRCADLQDDAGLEIGAEALQHHLEPVRARRQVRHHVGSVPVRHHGPGKACVRLRRCNGDAREYRTAAIRHAPGELTGGLREGGDTGQREHEDDEREPAPKAHHIPPFSFVIRDW